MTPHTDYILKAEELIERVGWVQGALRDSTGRVCLVGALYAACSFAANDPYRAAYNRLMKFSGSGNLAAWNDAPGRTKAEVLELLAEAAEA